MANVNDYVKYYRNKTFMEVPFNEVDALIFASLSYINLDGFTNNLPQSINAVATKYFEKTPIEKIKKLAKIHRDSSNLLNCMKNTLRYRDLMITDYQKVVDEETQFGAITIKSKDWVYISFEGTNNYISGWKEDFHLAHRFPIPSQTLAKEYINRNVKLMDRRVYIGGHSKGANLAVAGAMKALPSIKRRIIAVYDFDGPGLREKEFKSFDYRVIEPKIKKYVPSQSMVGMLMNYKKEFKTVNSNAKLILQHNLFTWNCFGSFFVEDSLSRKSIKLSKEIKKFISDYSEEEMEAFVQALFQVLKKANISQDDVISIGKFAKYATHIKELNADQKTKEKLLRLLNIVIEFHK